MPVRLRRHPTSERGDVTTTVMLMPVLLSVLMLVVQYALAFHARNIVTATAQDAALQAQVLDGTPDAARAAADDIVGDLGGRILDDVDVIVDYSADLVRVDVSGSVTRVVPFVDLRVNGSAEGPIERFRPESQR